MTERPNLGKSAPGIYQSMVGVERLNVHTRDALAGGEAAERAALELVEAITLISEDQVPDATYERAAAVAINGWNRIAISSRYPVRPEPA